MAEPATLDSISLKLPQEGKQLLKDQAESRYMRFSSYLRFLLLRGLEEAEDLEIEEDALIV